MSYSPDLSFGPAVCRICHSGETSLPYMGGSGGEPLISPCNCRGTMGLYHRSCVEHWLTISETACCEICKFKFEIKATYRSFWCYIRSRGIFVRRARYASRFTTAGRGTAADIICFLVLTPFTIGASVLCINAGLNAIHNGNGHDWNAPEGMAMILMALFLFIVYILWIVVTVSFYRNEYHSWREEHKKLTVVDQLYQNKSDGYNSRSTSHSHLISHRSFAFVSRLQRFFWKRMRPDPVDSPGSTPIPQNHIRFSVPYSVIHLYFVGRVLSPSRISPIASFYSAADGVEYPVTLYIPPPRPERTTATGMQLIARQSVSAPHSLGSSPGSDRPLAVAVPRAPTSEPPSSEYSNRVTSSISNSSSSYGTPTGPLEGAAAQPFSTPITSTFNVFDSISLRSSTVTRAQEESPHELIPQRSSSPFTLRQSVHRIMLPQRPYSVFTNSNEETGI